MTGEFTVRYNYKNYTSVSKITKDMVKEYPESILHIMEKLVKNVEKESEKPLREELFQLLKYDWALAHRTPDEGQLEYLVEDIIKVYKKNDPNQ